MRTASIIVALLSARAIAIPVAAEANGDNAKGLLDGLLGGGSGGDGLGGLLDGLLGPDGPLGDLTGDEGDGLVPGLIDSLLGGGDEPEYFIDPVKQGVPAGSVRLAKPQDGFSFVNLEVYSPPVGLIDGVLQALLGGKKSTFLTRNPAETTIKSVSGALFKVSARSITGVCCANDITLGRACVPTPCVFTVTGYVEGSSVGSLDPQTFSIGKRSISGNAPRGVGGGGGASGELEVDEVTLTVTPAGRKRDYVPPGGGAPGGAPGGGAPGGGRIGSVILFLGLYLPGN
ncbi:hypothetical protein ABW19_dt0209065 [Dactylella cylindrospora]|nr:hypothetical protein ABW19_dt0209065 [Dactylella cylindrospora]